MKILSLITLATMLMSFTTIAGEERKDLEVELNGSDTPATIVDNFEKNAIDDRVYTYTGVAPMPCNRCIYAQVEGKFVSARQQIVVPTCKDPNNTEILYEKIKVQVLCGGENACTETRTFPYCHRKVQYTKKHKFEVTNLSPVSGQKIIIKDDKVTGVLPRYSQYVMAGSTTKEEKIGEKIEITVSHRVVVMSPEKALELRELKSLEMIKGMAVMQSTKEANESGLLEISLRVNQIKRRKEVYVHSQKVPMIGINGRNVADLRSILKPGNDYSIQAIIRFKNDLKVLNDVIDPNFIVEPSRIEISN